MMNNVEICDVVHKVLSAESKTTVNSCCSTFNERPCFRFVFWYIGMCMMEVGHSHNPVVGLEARLGPEYQSSKVIG